MLNCCSGQSEEPEEESRKKAFLTEKYSDGKDIGTWASAGAEMMTRWDVMHGMEDGSFRPQGIYTEREQCCVSFLRLSEKTPVCLEKGNVPPLLTEEEYAEYLKESDLSRMSDCAVGLLPDGNQGSRVVIYDTDTWNYQDLMDLPDVTPDNYAAVTSDGKYIAYTDWSEASIPGGMLQDLQYRNRKDEGLFYRLAVSKRDHQNFLDAG